MFVFQDGCIICPTTDSTFDLRTGEIKEWYPNNPVLRALTPALRKLFVYPVKIDGENIYISIKGAVTSGGSAEIIFSGKAQPGFTASDVNIEEVSLLSSLLFLWYCRSYLCFALVLPLKLRWIQFQYTPLSAKFHRAFFQIEIWSVYHSTKKKSLSYLPEYNPLFYIFQVRMVIDEDVGGFGFTNKNELINGKAAIIGFLLLIDFELLTGKGLLKGTGLLDFIYAISRAFSS